MPVIIRKGKRGHMVRGRFVPTGRKNSKHSAKRKGK